MVETVILGLFDTVMCVVLIGLAWRLLTTHDLFLAVVLFICFGLFMALTWVRLKAPDVALAEAAIGAGVTGMLLLAALRRIKPDTIHSVCIERKGIIAVIVLSGVFAGILAFTLLQMPDVVPDTIKRQVTDNMAHSGVANPVTAVLLNFRGYDTLLEVVVLWAAALAVWSLGQTLATPQRAPDSILSGFARLLVPLMVLVSAYLLWVGAYAPGGAFQGGAVLAAAGLLWLSIGQEKQLLSDGLWTRFILVFGPLVFTLSALLLLFLQQQLLKYPSDSAGTWILAIESAALISIAATLMALFLGGKPPATEHKQDEEKST